MASFEDTTAKAPEFLKGRFNEQVATQFMEYIEEQEIESIDEVVQDIMQIKSSSIVAFVAKNCNLNDQEKEKFFRALRVLFELEREESKSTLNILNGVENQSSKQNIFGLEIKNNVLNIDWTNYTESECKETREYINKQCFNAFEHFDQSFITIETIGRNHEINIVPLLFDIYSYYKYKSLNSKQYQITHSQFCKKSKTLQALKYKDDHHQKIYSSIVQTMASFQHRINPTFSVNYSLKIDDDINSFIQYTLNVSNILKKIQETQQPPPMPLLIDLWIIPSKVKEALLSAVDDEDSDSEDESDDDSSSDEEDEKLDTMTKDFTINLEKYGVSKSEYEVATIPLDYNETQKCVKILEQTFRKILNRSRRSIKINIIIDRRKDKDNLLVYQLPLKYSAIPRNFCNETLIFSSSEHMMFDIDNTILKKDKKALQKQDSDPIFGAKFDCDGKMFCLSFALYGNNQNRIHFWRNGGGTRFWPNYMLSVWPRLFVNAKINKKYKGNDYIEKNFGLNTKDELFTSWYNQIVDFDDNK